ncbi:MAG: zinc ribbon domain-containing protein, partial [Cyanobacteria bacterium J083]
MAYAVNLSSNQHLTVTNQGKQTLISLVSITPGQQQSQSSSITTGAWTRPPQLYQTASGLVLQINRDQQQHFILIQGNRINPIAAPTWQNAVEIELENIPDSTATPTYLEFEPMQPMQMGNMSMNLDSMSMEMGNMSM